MDCPTEYQECVAFYQWTGYQKKIEELDLLHIPNEGKRHVGGWIKLKNIGLIKGASDYFLAIPSDHYHGFWLEMKRKDKKKSRTSKEQSAFIERQLEKGYYGAVVYGADEAISLVTDYLNNRKFI